MTDIPAVCCFFKIFQTCGIDHFQAFDWPKASSYPQWLRDLAGRVEGIRVDDTDFFTHVRIIIDSCTANSPRLWPIRITGVPRFGDVFLTPVFIWVKNRLPDQLGLDLQTREREYVVFKVKESWATVSFQTSWRGCIVSHYWLPLSL
jgi:hypothetical protein